jgi:Protein of unknown function (DUF1214)
MNTEGADMPQTQPIPVLEVSREWDELQRALADAARVVFADERVDSPLARAEASRYLMRLLQYAREALVENHDPAYPQLLKAESPYLQWAFPTPDYVYWYAPIHGADTYRIHGQRGTSRLFAVEVWEGDWAHMSSQRILSSKVHAIDGSGELEVGADGHLEITLGREPVEPSEPANWLRIADGVGSVVVRECYYDWESEQPADMYIERLGATYPASPPTAAELEHNLALVCEFLRTTPGIMAAGAAMHYNAPADRLAYTNIAEAFGNDVGFPEQLYARGHFRCAPDEAVIIETIPPPCLFWDVQLGSQFWEAHDWLARPVSINGHQAQIDTDGVFRAVIAQRDPGVPNWLDPGGHPHGTIGCRWNRFAGDTLPDAPTLRTVPLEHLREALPADTPTVNPVERSELLRRRMLSVRRRLAL